jgi:hypothetical protein
VRSEVRRPKNDNEWSVLAELYGRDTAVAKQFLWNGEASTSLSLSLLRKHNTFAIVSNSDLCGGIIITEIDYWNRNALVFLEIDSVDSTAISSIGAALRVFLFDDNFLHRAYGPVNLQTAQYARDMGALTEGYLPDVSRRAPSGKYTIIGIVRNDP